MKRRIKKVCKPIIVPLRCKESIQPSPIMDIHSRGLTNDVSVWSIGRSVIMSEVQNSEANGSVPVAEMAEMALGGSEQPKTPEPAGGNLRDAFKSFSKFGDIKSDGKQITLSQSDKWMKQAKVIDKKITTTDTGIHFKKLKSLKVPYDDYLKFLEDLANTKKVELAEIKNKLANCGAPGVAQKTPGKAASTVERLTDVKSYTGSHKERFDATGKGKGIAGRKDLVDATGYVSGYNHKDTYDKTH